VEVKNKMKRFYNTFKHATTRPASWSLLNFFLHSERQQASTFCRADSYCLSNSRATVQFTSSSPTKCLKYLQLQIRQCEKNTECAVFRSITVPWSKGKAISVQALRVPGGWSSQISRQSAHEGDKFVSPTHRPPLLPGNICGAYFC
jgi:hypothetical protein